MGDRSYSDQVPAHDRYRFLYRKCSCGRKPLTMWLYVPEFVEELDALCREGIEIKDETILPAMQKVYAMKLEEKRYLRKSGIWSDFAFKEAKAGMRDLRHAIERRQLNSDLYFLRSQWYVLNNVQFDIWMGIPEFTARIRERIDSGNSVSREYALEAMRDTYSEIKSEHSSKSFGDSRLKAMRNSINRMEQFVADDT